jgi:hypothetical protein
LRGRESLGNVFLDSSQVERGIPGLAVIKIWILGVVLSLLIQNVEVEPLWGYDEYLGKHANNKKDVGDVI